MSYMNKGYVVVTDYVEANTGADLSDALQKIILDNPHRTIYFPDGEYVIAKPICTPANPDHAVSLELSRFATVKAAEGWSDSEAMIRLGAAEPFNNITKNGSYYGIHGGIVDGSGVANGISIDSGRETVIESVSIKNTVIGVHIKHGANSNSSDADLLNVNIVGNNKIGSIGVFIEGSDNTFTNMRVAGVQIGVKIQGGSCELMRNVHVLYVFDGELASDEAFRDSYGFWDDSSMNSVYSNCYSDQFATGYRMRSGAKQVYSDCIAYWYTPRGGKQIGFLADGKFNSVLRCCNVHCKPACETRAYLIETEEGGKGTIYDPLAEPQSLEDKTYEKYLQGSVRSFI